MQYAFSDRISSLKASAIREILKFTSQPGVISFAAGNPASEAIPSEYIARLAAEILGETPSAALQYSITEGVPELRAHLKAWLKAEKSVGGDFDELIVTSGAQQAVELAAKALCNEGDVVLCEDPSFIGSLNSFRSYGAVLRGVPIQSDGMDLGALERLLQTEKNVRFIYTIPNFQNPTGFTASLEKRKALYALAKRYGVLILEDNPYEETRFAGEGIPSVKSLDTDGLVIYAGSFSKILSPGLRVGYACAPAPVIAKMVVCKQVSDVHTAALPQLIADRFLTGAYFAEHLQKIREIYRRKAGLMMSLADEYLLPKVAYTPVQGGLFLWCRLPEGADMQNFCRSAVEQSVAVVPGSAFLVDQSAPCGCFRLNYSTPADEQIIRGMEILGGVVKKIPE